MPAAIAVPARRRHDISDRVMEFSSAPCQLYCIYWALLNEWEVVLSWRHEAKTASLQSSSQEKRQHQEIPVSDT